ncbi:MAG: Na+/H+ antiporter subunit E [Candidatus Brocadiia bacterium]
MGRRLATFVFAFLAWCLLAWPYGEAAGGWDMQILIVGLGAALLVALICGEGLGDKSLQLFNPVRWFWLLCYIPVFAYYCAKANLQVAYLVLHPEMPIKPGIVKVKTRLQSKAALTALANCITLTPGTLTVEMEDDGTLYVHWIEVKSTQEDETSAEICERFDGFLKKIME